MPWKVSKILVWDVTCPDAIAPFHSSMALREAGSMVQEAEYTIQKYSYLSRAYFFVPIAVKSMEYIYPRSTKLFSRTSLMHKERNR